MIKGKKLEEDIVIWTKIFKTKYNYTKWRRLNSDLLSIIEDVLVYEQLKAKKRLKSSLFLEVLNDRKLNGLFEKEYRKNTKEQSKKQKIHSSDYINGFYKELQKGIHLEQNVSRNTEVNLNLTNELLDKYYLFNKLKIYCDSINYKNLLSLDLNLPDLEYLIKYLKDNPSLISPHIDVFLSIFDVLNDSKDLGFYEELIQKLNKYEEKIEELELRNMYIFAQNYCIQKINEGESDFLGELFKLFRALLENELIFDKGTLLPWDYKNIITVGLRLKEFEFIEEFIYKYNDYLSKDFRENALNYNLAKLYFHQEKYKKVIEYLRVVEYQDVFYSLDSRWTLLKTYYELGEFDAMFALYDSYKIYLLRNKTLSNIMRERYLNLIKLFKRIANVSPYDKERKEKLLIKVNSANNIPDKNWLIEKLEKK